MRLTTSDPHVFDRSKKATLSVSPVMVERPSFAESPQKNTRSVLSGWRAAVVGEITPDPMASARAKVSTFWRKTPDDETITKRSWLAPIFAKTAFTVPETVTVACQNNIKDGVTYSLYILSPSLFTT